MTAVKVANKSDVRPGRGCLVRCAGKELALFVVDGQYYALDNECAHLGGPLCDGIVSGTAVTCPWHDWTYDVRDGKEVMGQGAVKSFPCRVEGDDVLVETE